MSHSLGQFSALLIFPRWASMEILDRLNLNANPRKT